MTTARHDVTRKRRNRLRNASTELRDDTSRHVTTIALFHSVLGVRRGVLAAADVLRSHGHAVTVVDQYDGRVFEDDAEADTFAAGIGCPALMGAVGGGER